MTQNLFFRQYLDLYFFIQVFIHLFNAVPIIFYTMYEKANTDTYSYYEQ
jgi:hypothetical protein